MTFASSDPQALATKQAQRRVLLERRRSMPAAELQRISQQLCDALVSHELWRSARGVAAFIGVRNEVDTVPLLARGLAAGKAVWLPRLTGPGQMRFWSLGDLDALEPGRMGLREPPAIGPGEAMPGRAQGVDLVLVPGLGFGRDGARLGFGKGHYDRALARRAPADVDDLPLLGVCPAAFIAGDEPLAVVSHDVAMTHVLTERGIERCAR